MRGPKLKQRQIKFCVFSTRTSHLATQWSSREPGYASLVRPIVEYASVAWSPQMAKDISATESIQWRAVRFIFNDYPRNSSVSAIIADLNWQSLEERHIINDLTMFYKINFNVVNISFPPEINLGFQGTRRSHDYKFMPLSSSVNAYKYSSFPEQSWSGTVCLFWLYMRHLLTISKLVLYLITM